MDLFNYAREIFSIDTLDTRFTESAPGRPNVELQPTPRKQYDSEEKNGKPIQPIGVGSSSKLAIETTPSKWMTPEFIFYFVYIAVCLPQMFNTAYQVSKPSDPHYSKFENLLSPGWIFGQKVDNSDDQYSGFRDNLPYMLLLLIFHPLLRKAHQYVYSAKSSRRNKGFKTTSPNPEQAAARLNRRVEYDYGFGILFIAALHGFSAFKVLAILYINFLIPTRLPRKYVPWATWGFNIGILFANEFSNGYMYGDLAGLIAPQWTTAEKGGVQRMPNWGDVLDGYSGILPRWQVLFKMTVLRMISFNFDAYWVIHREFTGGVEKKVRDLSSLSERDRVETSGNYKEYSFRHYLAYTLYAPLFIAGPIITYNDYLNQQRYQPSSITTKRNLFYGIRFLVCLLTMEIVLHYLYVQAITKSHPNWDDYNPFQINMIGFWGLNIVWLKLLLPWRFFRLWSLVDGMDPPENMIRCMSNQWSPQAFWRAWHRSFYKWTVRYLYIPLGGSGASRMGGIRGILLSVRNLLIVFTFVAMWHDIDLKLLAWGWLIAVFVLPEILAGMVFPAKNWQNWPNTYRWLCALGAASNMVVMAAANLVGFVVGPTEMVVMLKNILGSWTGISYLALAWASLFVGSQVQMEVREQEKRDGIVMKF
ncbi:glycerol transporter [Agyrium rufum]|nr:glycerol transporter [Agyrium rufum]